MLSQCMRKLHEQEIQCYRELAVQGCSDIIQWWRDHRLECPTLSDLVRYTHGRMQGGGKTGIAPPWKLRLRSKILLKNKISSLFRLIYLILAKTVCLPMWHSHFTRVSSLFWYNAVMICISLNTLLWLQMQVAKLWSDLFCYWPLLRHNNMAAYLQRCTSSFGSGCFAACNCWTQTSGQVMQRDSDCW